LNLETYGCGLGEHSLTEPADVDTVGRLGALSLQMREPLK